MISIKKGSRSQGILVPVVTVTTAQLGIGATLDSKSGSGYLESEGSTSAGDPAFLHALVQGSTVLWLARTSGRNVGTYVFDNVIGIRIPTG